MIGILRNIEERVDTVDIFGLLEDLKIVIVLQSNPEMMAQYEIIITGLIERIQERIVLKWYE